MTYSHKSPTATPKFPYDPLHPPEPFIVEYPALSDISEWAAAELRKLPVDHDARRFRLTFCLCCGTVAKLNDVDLCKRCEKERKRQAEER